MVKWFTSFHRIVQGRHLLLARKRSGGFWLQVATFLSQRSTLTVRCTWHSSYPIHRTPYLNQVFHLLQDLDADLRTLAALIDSDSTAKHG